MAVQLSSQFLAGVVEGFYGTPWSREERLHLFHRMPLWRLQHYMYAPKDDGKHRADWRDLYTPVELATFKELHLAAEHNHVEFIYALSPGLNISFSSLSDRKCLLSKLQQLQSIGIRSFALLFDDIENSLSKEDGEKFSSPAEAQADLTNEVYLQTGKPRVFLFCPTEYCNSHTGPEVKESQYLTVIGDKLHAGIRVMWTGCRVVSNKISSKSIRKLSKVIKRKPVIWDNLHANDYDQRRLYLGPYDGRSVRLLSCLSGILSNPNNEFEMNYVPLYTLGAYCRCHQRVVEASLQPDSMDVDLSPSEIFSLAKLDLKDRGKPAALVDGAAAPSPGFDPPGKRASDSVKGDALQEMDVIPGGEGKSSLYDPRKSLLAALEEWIPYFYDSSYLCPATKECPSTMDTETVPCAVAGEVEMECEKALKSVSQKYRKFEGKLGVDDLSLLCDMFYLPGEHGPAGKELLQEAAWLKEYCYKMQRGEGGEEGEGENGEKREKGEKGVKGVKGMEKEWLQRSEHFHSLCERVVQLGIRLVQIPNRTLFRQIYPYLWDCKEAVLLFDSFLKWIAQSREDLQTPSYLPKDPSCLSGGGITGDFQRLLPYIEHSTELFSYKDLPSSSMEIITIRPFQEEDRAAVDAVCIKTEEDPDASCPPSPEILASIRVAPYLELSSNMCFVAEDNWGVCGYIMATCDSTKFYKFLTETWLPRMRKKYPCPKREEELSTEERLCLSVYQTKIDMASPILSQFPSHFQVELLPRARGKGIVTRMIRCIVSVLKAKGAKGIHVEVDGGNKNICDFYINLGFKVLSKFDQLNKSRTNCTTLGRML